MLHLGRCADIAKGLVMIARTPGGKAEAVDLTSGGRKRAVKLAGSCE
jgi:hypothetical protein